MVDLIPTKEEWDAALEMRHGKELQRRFSSATVAVCGLGGLGSNIALCLARAGIGRLILIDFDRVDTANLHRQQYGAEQVGMYKTDATVENLSRVAPYLKLVTHTVRLDSDNAPSLLQEADVICEAFDNAEAKAMLADVVLSRMTDKYLVAASGMAGFGSANDIRTRVITSRFILCGDGVSEVSSSSSLLASRVMLCAAHEAHAVLRLLGNAKDAKDAKDAVGGTF